MYIFESKSLQGSKVTLYKTPKHPAALALKCNYQHDHQLVRHVLPFRARIDQASGPNKHEIDVFFSFRSCLPRFDLQL